FVLKINYYYLFNIDDNNIIFKTIEENNEFLLVLYRKRTKKNFLLLNILKNISFLKLKEYNELKLENINNRILLKKIILKKINFIIFDFLKLLFVFFNEYFFN